MIQWKNGNISGYDTGVHSNFTLTHWAEEHGVILEFIKPGKPIQNAFIERFNREILDFYLFRTLNEVREITERWLREYNQGRPYESLNNLSPEEYLSLAEITKSKKVCGTETGVLITDMGITQWG